METAINAQKSHVLVLPYPAQGHINPMLQFCKRLVSKGVKTTLAVTTYISKTMYATDPNSSSVDVQTISDGYDDGGFAQADSVEVYLESLKVVGSKTLADLIRKLEEIGSPVGAVIYDGFLPWALDVAKDFGLVGALFFTQTSAVNNIYYHVYKGLLPLPLSESKVLVPGVTPLEPWEAPSFLNIYGSYPGFFHTVVNQFSNIDRADWVFFSIFQRMEEDVLNWMSRLWRVRTIGPTIPSMYLDKRLEDDKDYGINLFRPDSSACINWLNSRPSGSVVYVSFGSMAELEAEQVKEIAFCLKDGDFSFLWVVRTPEKEKLPLNFMEETAGKGLVVGWSPQLEVLAHQSIGCFVTHCGFNSVLEALSLGVPVVAMPQWTDQGTNAKYVEDVWCIGLRTKREENGIVRREALLTCLREVLIGERGKEIRDSAIKWKALAKEAVDEGGSSDKNIDEFVAAMDGQPFSA